MSRELLGWLFERRKTKLIDGMKRHLALTMNCVEELQRAVMFSAGGAVDEEQLAISRLSKKEMEADALRREITYALAKSELTPEDKDDLGHLVRGIDWIADWAREAGRILSIIPFHKADRALKDDALTMLEKIRECVAATRMCVERLTENIGEALTVADSVEKLEEDADELYQKCRKTFLQTTPKTDIGVADAVLFAQFLDSAENIADWCENAVDQVRVIAVHVSKASL